MLATSRSQPFFRSIAMRYALAACFLVAYTAGVVRADEGDELAIEDFHFTWTVAVAGNTRFLIEKDQKSTSAGLRYKAEAISMTVEDAAAVGEALARTDEYFEKLKDSKGQSDSVRAGRIHVTFKTTDKGDFFVSITPEKWMRVFATLKLDEAKALAGPMKKAVRAGAIVDRKVKF